MSKHDSSSRRHTQAVFLRRGFKRRLTRDDDLHPFGKFEAHCWAIYFESRFKHTSSPYQSGVAPAVTLLFCLRGHFAEKPNLQFVNLCSCCWHKSEWFHRPGQASLSVAFGAAGSKLCLFSLRRKRRSRPLTVPMLLLSIKVGELRLSSLFWLMVSMREAIGGGNRESKGDICAGLGSHWVDLGHSCSGLRGADGKRRGYAVKRHRSVSQPASLCVC